jgi:hypothetical protein
MPTVVRPPSHRCASPCGPPSRAAAGCDLDRYRARAPRRVRRRTSARTAWAGFAWALPGAFSALASPRSSCVVHRPCLGYTRRTGVVLSLLSGPNREGSGLDFGQVRGFLMTTTRAGCARCRLPYLTFPAGVVPGARSWFYGFEMRRLRRAAASRVRALSRAVSDFILGRAPQTSSPFSRRSACVSSNASSRRRDG